jgi:hypothetical protein
VGARVCAPRRLNQTEQQKSGASGRPPEQQNRGTRGIVPRLPLNPPLTPPFQGGESEIAGPYRTIAAI